MTSEIFVERIKKQNKIKQKKKEKKKEKGEGGWNTLIKV